MKSPSQSFAMSLRARSMRRTGLALLALFIPLTCLAALVNINTADQALLETLRNIGPTKAAAIIDYRTKNGPFQRIEDIMNVRGIGQLTFDDIKDSITVGDAAPPPVSTSTPAPSSGSGQAPYTPPPSGLFVNISGPLHATLHTILRFTASVTTKTGGADPTALITWSFGDGSAQTGTVVEKTYPFPGKYLVVARAHDGAVVAEDDLAVVVEPAEVQVRMLMGRGVMVTNMSEYRLDLSGWRLMRDTQTFLIPEGTALLPLGATLFADEITHLVPGSLVTLLYPNGEVAASSSDREQLATVVQPFDPDTRTTLVKATDSNPGTPPSTPYVEPALAPAASNDLAAAGAPMLLASATPNSAPGEGSLLPWIVGLVGVILVAGGVFVFL